jgi:polyisoprenoid-binding protein YceI
MKHIKSLVLATSLFAATTAFAASETYSVDKSHSSTTFKVRHLMANVTGKFNDYDATINIDRANLANSNVEFTIKAASIDTDSENRDKHLQSEDFFFVEKHPTITFKSTAVKATKEKDVYNVTGDFTMRGVTRRITLPVSVLGFGKDPWGNEKAGFEITTKLNRKDYDINWNKSLDAGGVLLGDDVVVNINLEAVKKK